MNGASKILTVSYGTFSCTLEGFDDPFNTMKAIAEYFRDLAAGDRYFGAEPPQPDAAMLHRIAEREIQRRVEAKIQENGVILRAEENGAIAAPVDPAPVAPAIESPKPVVQMPARSAAPAPKPAPTVSDSEAGSESVAEKLSRLRKAAAQHQASAQTAAVVTASVPASFDDDDDAFTEDKSAEAVSAPVMVSDAEAEAEPSSYEEIYEDSLPEDLAASAEDVMSGDLVPEQQTAADVLAEEPVDAEDLADLMSMDAPMADDIVLADDAKDADDDTAAATLDEMADGETTDDVEDTEAEQPAWDDTDDRLLASIGAEATAPETDAASEELDATTDDALIASLGSMVDPEDQIEAATAPVQDHAAAEIDLDTIAAAVAEDTETVYAAEPALVDDETDFSADADDGTGTALTLAEEEDQTEAAEALIAVQAAEDFAIDLEKERGPVVPVRPTRPVRPLRPALAESDSAPQDAGPAAAPVAPVTAEAENESRTPISVEKLQRARARVIKIRRADVSGPSDNVAPDPVAATATLSHEAEAALAAELAAVEREASATSQAESDAPQQDASVARKLAPNAEDAAVDRLMNEASTQMEVPDTKRRMSAIAHLKAAVAATIAERRATGNTLASDGSERMGAYRDDLAKVVRPTSSTATMPLERPAPLVLVSEQRIDRPSAPSAHPSATAVQPIQPRRPLSSAAAAVAAELDMEDDLDLDDDTDNIFESDSGFPEFAERLGATELTDLLEAAAAYIACVEGRDSFTRPQLMRHIAAATDDLTREDGLRSFGTLLRNGVIERSRRGQFAISKSSILLSEARKISG